MTTTGKNDNFKRLLDLLGNSPPGRVIPMHGPEAQDTLDALAKMSESVADAAQGDVRLVAQPGTMAFREIEAVSKLVAQLLHDEEVTMAEGMHVLALLLGKALWHVYGVRACEVLNAGPLFNMIHTGIHYAEDPARFTTKREKPDGAQATTDPVHPLDTNW